MFNAKGETYFGETPDVDDERNNLLHSYVLFVGAKSLAKSFDGVPYTDDEPAKDFLHLIVIL